MVVVKPCLGAPRASRAIWLRSHSLTTRCEMVFSKASNGTVTLESAGWEGGRLLPGSGLDKVLYTVADHLGSVRVVKDGSGVIRQRFDYYPYGTVSYVWTNSSTTDSSEKRYRFGGKEIAGSSLTDLAGTGAAPGASYLDFGARLYSPRTATWLSPDPLMEKYYGISPFVYCASNPVNRIDIMGEWDVTVHLYKDRSEYGYGIATVTDRKGNKVFSFVVRAEGVKGHNRMNAGADTPLGTYDIPNNYPWISGGNRESYGPNPRLNMEGESGEIVDSGRSLIRMHGGRQEYKTKDGKYIGYDNPVLKKTEGCIRAYDRDMLQCKTITDFLQIIDAEEQPGHIYVIDDLERVRVNANNNYVEYMDIYQEPAGLIDWMKELFDYLVKWV